MIAFMCLIVFALEPDPRYRLVLTANRDEFHERPAQPMHWWSRSGPLAGRDAKSGGTWLGIAPDGRLGAVTNLRSGLPDTGTRSRGELPLSLLAGPSMEANLTSIESLRGNYGPFSVLGFDGQRMHFTSNEAASRRQLDDGLHGLSNHLLDTPWPKLNRGCQSLAAILQAGATGEALHDALIREFTDSTPAPDATLPDTGVGLELERALSSVFIRGRVYGTRATTVVSLTHDGIAEVSEQCYGPDGVEGVKQRFRFDTLTAASRSTIQ